MGCRKVRKNLDGTLAAVGGMGFAGICLANPLAWGCALVYCLVMVGRLLAGKNGKKKGRAGGGVRCAPLGNWAFMG